LQALCSFFGIIAGGPPLTGGVRAHVMNAPTYIQQPVTITELHDLVVLATQELEDFFQRNSHLISNYIRTD
jgi:hypothetical protein